MPSVLAALALLFVYWESVLSYLREQHYQEHFVYLWVFLGAALWRSLKRPFRSRFGWSTGRDFAGLAACMSAVVMLWFSFVAGSSTGLRTSLVAFLTGIAVLAVQRWTVKRCLLHGILLLLCFGFPYSVYFPITSQLQIGVVWLISLPAQLGLANYTVEGNVVFFPHYELAITADCSGLGQLLTFFGIASLGVLSSDQKRSRTVMVLALAVALAWLSNLARVALFVALVAIGWTDAIDNDTWHAAIGFLVFLPFVLTLIVVILRTHVPLPPWRERPLTPGRVAIAWLVVPLLLVQFAFGREEVTTFAEPPHFAGLTQPPGHVLTMRAPSEANDKGAYATPWLVNARFTRDDGSWFDLFHYRTRSRSHLCVHKIADCLAGTAGFIHYEPPVDIDGKRWWRIALDGDKPTTSTHVYFAFEVGGRRLDDSPWTQIEVIRQRAFGGDWDVQLTRVTMPGPLPASPTAYEQEVLTWLGRQIQTPP